MGMMIFPGEKINDILPPRQSNEDFVGRLGAWLTSEGAVYAGYITFACSLVCIIIKSIQIVNDFFKEGLITGIIMLFIIGPILLLLDVIAMYLSFIPSFIAGVIIWLLGWVCYNKWTLLSVLLLATIFCIFKFYETLSLQYIWDNLKNMVRQSQ